MEVLGLRRSQSLRTLSGAHERSWVTPAPTQWERKSVFQLVQHYQSCAELQISAQAEHKLQVSESSAERQWRRLSSVDRQGPGRNVNLSRSRSMDYLPQREVSGTKELCALFESKANRQHSFSSNPQLAATGSKTREDCPLQDWRYNKTPLKDTVIQVEEGKATNGHLESYDRASRHSHENKNCPSLIERGTAVKQGRDRISTSSSVRDRSVLYLSRAAAINPTGGSTPAEFTEKKGAKAKPSKFQSTAKEVCSACLTPVYPMEKMVANKLTLHNNCFCCKHCKNKLSLHNYSSSYGEFYCISHYQQLFKRKGNYDEGFGHEQHKHRWLPKNKEVDEPDTNLTLKTTKGNSDRHNSFREFSAKSTFRQPGSQNTAVRGHLRIIWPPEKKDKGINSAQWMGAPARKNKNPVFGNSASHSEHKKNDKIQLQFSDGKETKEKVNRLSTKFMSRVTGQSKAAFYNSAHDVSFKEIKCGSDSSKEGHIRESTSTSVLNCSSTSSAKAVIVSNQKVSNVAPPKVKSSIQTSNGQDACLNKGRKFVHFAPNPNIAQKGRLILGGQSEDHNSSDQSDRLQVNQSTGMTDIGGKNHADNLPSECEKAEFECEGISKTSEFNSSKDVTNTVTENDGKEESRKEIQQLCDKAERATESPDMQNFNKTESLNETDLLNKDTVTDQEPSKKLDVINSVIPVCSENPSTLHIPAEHNTKENHKLDHDEADLAEWDSANQQEITGSQKKTSSKTNAVKPLVTQTEKSKGKRGSWSKGKSPFSKLFTSNGNDNSNKLDPKDAKKANSKPTGLLGRLFQTSSEKTEDADEAIIAHADDKTTEDVHATHEMQKESRTAELQQVEEDEQEVDGHMTQDNTATCSKQVEIKSAEPFNVHKRDDDIFAVHAESSAPALMYMNPADLSQSNLHNKEAPDVFSTDTEITDSEDWPIAGQTVIQASDRPVNQSIPENSDNDVLNDPFNSNSGDTVGYEPADLFVNEVNMADCVQEPNELMAAPDGRKRKLCEGTLFSTDHEVPKQASDLLAPSDSLVSPIGEIFSAAGTSTDGFCLFDSQLQRVENPQTQIMSAQLPIAALPRVGPISANSQTNWQDAEFDIFSSEESLLTEPPILHRGTDASMDHIPLPLVDVFGMTETPSSADALTVLPVRCNAMNEFTGSDASFTAAPSAQIDLLAGSVLTSEQEMLLDASVDSLLKTNNEQPAENNISSRSWMDDLFR